MVEGFWIVQYEAVGGNGGAVAVLINGRVYGGDSAYTFTGEYQTEGDSITARLMVRSFLPGVPSVLGAVGDYGLVVRGTLQGGVIRAKGSLPGRQGAGIVLKLTKRADLPT
jgi:hypothetical protein